MVCREILCSTAINPHDLHSSCPGDHLFYSSRQNRLGISTVYVKNVAQQVVSLRKMLDYDFLHILPGHSRRFSFVDATDRLQAITAIAERHS